MMFAWVVMCCYYATDFQEQKGFVRFLLLPPISVVWFVRLPSRNNSRLLLMRVEFGLRDAGERESEKSGQRSTQRKSRAILFTKGILFSENLSGHERFRWNRKNEHRNIRKSEGKKAALLEVIEL